MLFSVKKALTQQNELVLLQEEHNILNNKNITRGFDLTPTYVNPTG